MELYGLIIAIAKSEGTISSYTFPVNNRVSYAKNSS